MKTFVENILDEAALDARVPNGMVDLLNEEHVTVLAEKMIDHGIDPSVVQELVNRAVQIEGKYPDRQAYNKEGWLVTFPSKQYRDIAIKKGTHYPNDPTHGQGGMNLYYKRKGKQQRQTHQDVTSVDPAAPQQSPTAPATPQAPAAAAPKPAADPKATPSEPTKQSSPTPAQPTSPDSTSTLPKSTDDPASADQPADANPSTPPSAPTPPAGPEKPEEKEPVAPAPQQPVEPAISIPTLSTEFAKSKQWSQAPYGEWRNQTGETTAVTGLTGEVVSIKYVDREEFKLFVEKRKGQ
jgi:hypothetical protein